MIAIIVSWTAVSGIEGMIYISIWSIMIEELNPYIIKFYLDLFVEIDLIITRYFI